VYVHTLDLPLFGGKAKRVMKIVGDQAWERAIRKGWIPPTEDVDDFQTRRYNPTVSAQQNARSRQVRAMDGVIVPSEYLKRMVVGWGVDASKVHVIYNALPPAIVGEGLRSSPTSPEISQSDTRRQLGLPDAPLLITAARLVQWKGVNHLIDALAQVRDVRLLVAGDGPMEIELRQRAAKLGERVTFLGRVSREKMPLYLKAADYLALYSGYEGLSHTLLESLREGTPVIASDKGGNPEVVQHEVNGLLVPYVNVEALAAAIQDAFQPGKRRALAANHHVGMERFDFTHMVEQTAQTLAAYCP
jgi:glycosyltransferase involved in cell wall biosynthesis